MTATIKVTEKQITDLYRAVNEMLAVLGANGDITTRHNETQNVMEALAIIDGGEYNEKANLQVGYMENYNEFCKNKKCPEYIEWSIGYGSFFSCKKIGESENIECYPSDCLFITEIRSITLTGEYKD